MGVTIRDVARKAGVSISTVSRVLNDTCPVEDGKRHAVVAAVRDLGYIPNPSARALLKKETGGLGILMPYVTGEFFSDLLNGLDYTAKEQGYFLLISTSHDEVLEWRAAVRALHRRVDGLAVYAPQLTPAELSLESDVPTVFVNSPLDRIRAEEHDVITFDNEDAAHAAARHLIELGHRRIAYVRGPEGWFDAEARLAGFLRATRDLPEAHRPVLAGSFHQEDGIRAAHEILAMDPWPTAIMAANDYCAAGIIRGLAEAGVSVPQDISVIGFDDVLSSRYTTPPLTTMSVPIRRVGEETIRLLVSRVTGVDLSPPSHRHLEVPLVIRGTTAPPRS